MDDSNQQMTQDQMYAASSEVNVPAPSYDKLEPSQPNSMSGIVYASFFQRLLAALIDAIIVGFGMQIITRLFGLMGDSGVTLGSLVSLAFSFTYAVYFISQRGQTPGKQIIGIRVQDISTGQNLDVISAIVREVIGKFILSMVLLLGYFWMLWDDKKQTWHDKLAKSVVVKVNK
ncbi:RDD family protein [Patescibacteria group bacterium]|nr:RDD family protein [Patescibacteria group bacterium]MBU1970280.1 RDD family protein [Patescibacteria group bacterium]